jgi:hypothetical protein
MGLYNKEQLNALIVTGMRLGYWDDVRHFTKQLNELKRQEREEHATVHDYSTAEPSA